MMILYLDTSTSVCHVSVDDGTQQFNYEWHADRTLADGLLDYIIDTVRKHNMTLHDISGVAVYRGPGSFTGLRIGCTVSNTLAKSLSVPVVGETGENWMALANKRLKNGQNDQLVLPLYGREANITSPRK